MNPIFANIKTTIAGATPLGVGALMVLAGLASLFHIPVNGVAVTGDPLTMIGAGFALCSTGLGLFEAKDGTTHSTIAQVEQSTAKSSENAVAASVAQSSTK
jgi:hypothetical protein